MSEGEGLPEEKVSVECLCGKRYRIPVKSAGAKLTCKVCGEKVRVPRAAKISDRSRNDILAEFGIDSDVAKEKYKEEKLRETPQPKVYRCSRCVAKIAPSDVKGAYVKGELLCKACRDSDLVNLRASGEADAAAAKRDKKVAVAKEKRAAQDQQTAMLAAGAYSLLFFVGIFGPAYFVFGAKLVAAIGLATIFAGVGAACVYAHRRGLAFF